MKQTDTGWARAMLLAVLCLSALALSADVWKPVKITHNKHSQRDGIETEILELGYDDMGRLVRFCQYYAWKTDDPQFDMTIDWESNPILVTGIYDYENCNTLMWLNDAGLLDQMYVQYGEYDRPKIQCYYESGKLTWVTMDGKNEQIVLENSNGTVTKLRFQYSANYGEDILLMYPANPVPCTIPHPVFLENCFFAYRVAAYAGLIGNPISLLPSQLNRYDDGWIDLNYTFDENGNIATISTTGPMTHGSFDRGEEFIYEYELTEGVSDINEDTSVTINGLECRVNKSVGTINLFNAAGIKVAESTNGTVSASVPGLYILQHGNIATKISLR